MTVRLRIVVLILVSVVAHSPPALAHRPFTTEDAGTVEPGHLEVEIGHDYVDDGHDHRSFAGIYTANIGLWKRAEVDISTTLFYRLEEAGERSGGFGDTELLAKYRLLDERGSRPAMALVGKVTFPTGDADEGLGSGKASYSMLGVLSKSMGRWTVHGNVGWDFLRGGEDQMLASVAVDYRMVEGWHLLAEWDGATDFRSKTVDETSGVLLGLLWTPSDRMAWDAGVRLGGPSGDSDMTLTFGLTFGF
jgi:hypothetical protein